MKIKASYLDRCKGYVQWLGGPLFAVDESLPDIAKGELTAVEAMFNQETHGKGIKVFPVTYKKGEEPLTCSEPRMFDALYKGKQCREFAVKQWKAGVKSKEFWPEEFLGCSGLRSVEEFRSIFGRGPTLPLLRRILQEVECELKVLSTSAN